MEKIHKTDSSLIVIHTNNQRAQSVTTKHRKQMYEN